MTLEKITSLLGLSQPGRRILVVEDHVPWLVRLQEFWEQSGHVVVAMAGVDEIKGNHATGRGADLQSGVTVDLTRIEVAFLDYYFLSSKYNGASFARELMLRGAPKILGMSSDKSANVAMEREGAVATLRKADFMRLL